MSSRWIVNGPENGIEHFKTEQRAIEYAQILISECLDGDEWDERVEEIFVACIAHQASQVDVAYRKDQAFPEGGDRDATGRYWGEHDCLCNYELVEVEA